MEKIGEYPGCGHGVCRRREQFCRNFACRLVRDKINGEEAQHHRLEPTSCPTLTGRPSPTTSGDVAQTTPLLPMHTLGHDFIPESIHAAGSLPRDGADREPPRQREAVEPRPTTSSKPSRPAYPRPHRGFRSLPLRPITSPSPPSVDEARRAREEGKEKMILFNCSGHGIIDPASYDDLSRGNSAPRAARQGDRAGPEGHRETPEVYRKIGRCAAGSTYSASDGNSNSDQKTRSPLPPIHKGEARGIFVPAPDPRCRFEPCRSCFATGVLCFRRPQGRLPAFRAA